MRTSARLLLALALVTAIAALPTQSSAAMQWQLSARSHYSGVGPFDMSHAGFSGATRIALSIKTATRQRFVMQGSWTVGCVAEGQQGSPPPERIKNGLVHSFGLGTKERLEIGVKRASSCQVDVHVMPTGSVNALTVTLWRSP